MPLYRMQVTFTNEAEAFPDTAAVTTFYLDDLGPSSDPTQLAIDAAAAFAAFPPGYADPISLIEVRAYEIADLLGAPTGPPVGKGTAAPFGPSPAGPREVACCLSYYADRNEPRRRGRMYIGPFRAADMTDRPEALLRGYILDIGDRILGLGGIDVSWVQYSSTENTSQGVTNYYVDDAWDTQRSRGKDPTARDSRTVGP